MTEEPTPADYDAVEAESEIETDPDRPASGTAGSGPDAGSDAAAGPEPAEPTYGWGEYDCTRCGSATDRAWRGAGGFVCPDCKEW